MDTDIDNRLKQIRSYNMGRPRKDIKQNIQSKIKIMSYGCWEWQANINKKTGYSKLRSMGKDYLVHRLSYEIFKGHIPKGLIIDHLCRNRKCVNPNHLEAVTFQENILRGRGIAAINSKKTHCIRGHLFSEDNIYRRKDRTDRNCKKCMTIRSKKYLEVCHRKNSSI